MPVVYVRGFSDHNFYDVIKVVVPKIRVHILLMLTSENRFYSCLDSRVHADSVEVKESEKDEVKKSSGSIWLKAKF